MTDTYRVLEVDRGDYRHTRLIEQPVAEVGAGQVLLHIERFALTANNITYAAAGDLLDYWGFFPSESPWGRIPVMGLSTVAASGHPDIAEGGRYFGFYAMATHLLVEPGLRADGFVDGVAHRANHATPYRTYQTATNDGAFRLATQDRYLLLRGLFLTSFLVDDFLADHDFYDAGTVVVTSASSKTSLALAHRLTLRDDIRSIGMTSATNRDFVEATGLYDEVTTYDDVADLAVDGGSVLVDMAGSAELLADLHRRLEGGLAYSCRVGGTHWEDIAGDADIVGPTPEFFFAPTQITKRNAEWGADTFDATTAGALTSFIADSERWLTVDHHAGPEALVAAYGDLVDNRQPPDRGVIASMWPDDLG